MHTNYVTITGFLAVYESDPLPPLAFLRGGTFNTVANSVGIPRRSPDGLLANLIRRYRGREQDPLRCVERHVLRMGSHYGFIFGTGAIHGFIDDYNRTDDKNTLWAAKVLGRAAANVALGRETRVARRWQGKVTFDDGAHRSPTATTSPSAPARSIKSASASRRSTAPASATARSTSSASTRARSAS